MNWRNLYLATYKVWQLPGFFLITFLCATSMIVTLYMEDSIDFSTQYVPLIASLLYFLGRIAFGFYNKFEFTLNELLGYAFVLLTAFALAGQYMLGMDYLDQENKSSWTYTFAMWAFGLTFFFAGASCSAAKYSKSTILALILCALVAVPLFEATQGKIMLDYSRMRYVLGRDDFTHLAIAEWAVFLFMAAYAFAGRKFRPLVIVIAILCLFSMQGRSSTLFTITAFVIYGFLTDGRKFILTIAGIALLAFVANIYFPVEDLLFEEHKGSVDRMLLSGDKEDGSLEGRAGIFTESIGHLPNSALFGDPTFMAREGATMGSYIHNLLSLWQFFGVLPFALMIVMLFRALRTMYHLIRFGNPSVVEEAMSLMLLYVVVSVIFSKSIVFDWIWFVTGYWMLRYSTVVSGLLGPKRNTKRKSQRYTKYRPGTDQKLRF